MTGKGGYREELPPHAEEAERAVLGCVLLEPGLFEELAGQLGAGAEAMGRSGDGAEVFYVVRHQEVYRGMAGLVGEGKPIEVILLTQRLRDQERLEGCGGAGYVSGLMEATPGASMFRHFLGVVWEKFLARRMIGRAIGLASALQAQGGFNESLVAQFAEGTEGLRRAAVKRGNVRPERLRSPLELEEDVREYFFGKGKGSPGLSLPASGFGGFDWRVRGSELTFAIGEKGNGKSTFLSYLALHLAAQGEPPNCPVMVVASMETRRGVTLGMLVQQLLGVREIEDTPEGNVLLAEAVGWLERRLLIFDFLGIADWRELLGMLDFVGEYLAGRPEDRWAPRVVALVDSVMRLGIMDDDYAQQGLAAVSFSGWTVRHHSHLFLVNHLNKAKGSRGSQQWVDNANNVVEVERNERKQRKLDDLRFKGVAEGWPEARFLAAKRELEGSDECGWDCRMTLRYQRWPGSQQNGRRYLSYDVSGGLQFFSEQHTEGVDWLRRWRSAGARPPARGQQTVAVRQDPAEGGRGNG